MAKRSGPKPIKANEWAREQLGLPSLYPDETDWMCSVFGCHAPAVKRGPCKDWYCQKHIAFGRSVLPEEG